MSVSFHRSTTNVAKAGEDPQGAENPLLTCMIQSHSSSPKLSGVYICTPTLLSPLLILGLGREGQKWTLLQIALWVNFAMSYIL